MSVIDNNNSERGIPVGSKSPIEALIDINNRTLEFKEVLKTTEGILIDFFRGAF
ncbi:MAG: hypothetical protein ACQERB_03955 [Promethearchaeati archaeon]